MINKPPKGCFYFALSTAVEDLILFKEARTFPMIFWNRFSAHMAVLP